MFWSKAAARLTTGEMARRLEVLRAAEALDPDAFKPTMVPYWSVEQLFRQRRAIAKAEGGAGAGGVR